MHASHLDADRQLGDQLGEARVDGPADADDVDARPVGDGETDCRPAVDAHQRLRRVLVALDEAADVADPQELGARTRAGSPALQAVEHVRGERQGGDLLDRAEGPRRRDAQPPVLDIDKAGVDHLVLGLQGPGDRRLGDAEQRQLGLLDLEIDDAALHAPQIDATDAVDEADLALQRSWRTAPPPWRNSRRR